MASRSPPALPLSDGAAGCEPLAAALEDAADCEPLAAALKDAADCELLAAALENTASAAMGGPVPPILKATSRAERFALDLGLPFGLPTW